MINTNRRFTGGAQLFSQDKTAIGPTGRVLMGATTVSTIATATAVTLTAAQLLGGLILQDPSGGAVTSTAPTAALLWAALPGVQAGTGFRFTIRNTADAAETITLQAGTGGTISGTATIAQNNSKDFIVVLGGTKTSPSYVIYSVGTYVH